MNKNKWNVLFTIFCLSAIVVGTLLFEYKSARNAVHNYVYLWEDDISESQIWSRDQNFKKRIIDQIYSVHPAVKLVSEDPNNKTKCALQEEISLSYRAISTATLKVCYSESALLWISLTSPVMFGGLIAFFLFLFFQLSSQYHQRISDQKLAYELALNRQIAEVARHVAHDIRGPLMGLRAVGSHAGLQGEAKSMLYNSVERIHNIAEDLLKMGSKNIGSASLPLPEATPETNSESNSEPIPTPTPNAGLNNWIHFEDLKGFISEFKIANPDVNLSYSNSTSLESVNLAIHPRTLERILLNLIKNSMEALTTKGAMVALQISELERYYVFEVIDEGKGISEELLENVLIKGASMGKANGHGIGLLSVCKLVRQHEGEITIRSKVDVGTVVAIKFPKKAPLYS